MKMHALYIRMHFHHTDNFVQFISIQVFNQKIIFLHVENYIFRHSVQSTLHTPTPSGIAISIPRLLVLFCATYLQRPTLHILRIHIINLLSIQIKRPIYAIAMLQPLVKNNSQQSENLSHVLTSIPTFIPLSYMKRKYCSYKAVFGTFSLTDFLTFASFFNQKNPFQHSSVN